MVLSSDQGTVVSVDGAKTWSTWYNQPTAEIYHMAADNRFPYWLYGAQQDQARLASAPGRAWACSISATGSQSVSGREQHGGAGSRGWQPAVRQRRSALQPGAEFARARRWRTARSRPQRPQPQNMDTAASVFRGRQGSLLLKSICFPHARPRQDLGKDQPRSHPPASRSAEDTRCGNRKGHRRANDRSLRRRVHASARRRSMRRPFGWAPTTA